MPTPTIQEMKERKMYLVLRNKETADQVRDQGRTFTPDELATIDDNKKEVAGLEDDIRKAEETDRRYIEIQSQAEDLAKPGALTPRPAPSNIPGERRIEFPHSMYRVSDLKAFSGATRQEAEERAYRSGMWFLAQMGGNPGATRWCERNGLEVRTMSENVMTAGGVLVPDELATAVIELREKYGVIRQEAMVWPMKGDTLDIPRSLTDPTVYSTAEGATITASDPTLDMVTLTARKWGCLVKLPTELDEDAVINIADLLARGMARAFAKEEDSCAFAGTGTAAYHGIIGICEKIRLAGSGYVAWVDATSGEDTFAEIDKEDISALMAGVAEYALDGAKFYCSGVANALVFNSLKAAGGGNTIQTLEGKPSYAYLGYPIVTTPTMPVTQSTINNTAMILFGNLNEAVAFGDRRGIRLAKSTERYFEQDIVAIKATERVDIVVHSIGDTTNPGPVAALMGNS